MAWKGLLKPTPANIALTALAILLVVTATSPAKDWGKDDGK